MRSKKSVGMIRTSLSDLLFDVEKVEFTDFAANSNCAYQVIGYPNETKTLLNQCSNIYELVPNKLIFPSIEEVLNNNNITFEKHYYHINNARFYVDYNITDEKFAYTFDGTNDKIQPQITVNHSYNGQTKYRIVVGYFRMVCTNGLVISVKEMDQYNLCIIGKHTKEILHSFERLDNIIKLFTETSNVMDQITAKYQRLANLNFDLVSLPSLIEKTLKLAGIKTTENGNYNSITDIYNRITNEFINKNLEYKSYNNWLLYNGINSYLNDNNLNISTPDVRRVKDQTVFELLLAETEA